MKLTYRPEIDGLRAIAVGIIIIYHAQINFLDVEIFKGGFIGVDIFFVISGYLITSIILKELVTTGTFSFKYFYERRIRRILPALLFVMLISSPFAWNLLLPKTFIEFANSIIFSLGFSSNIYFWYSGQIYGAQSGELIPFLHTWSLSVEEQFYILFPIVLLVTFKYFRKYLIHILILGFVISLGLADYGSKNYPSLNFYILPTRMWELLAGAILAYFEITKGYRAKITKVSIFFPFLGLILLIYSSLFYDDGIYHPSLYTILPIIGSCLIIWFSNKDELITKLLSSKIFVKIGLISYSLYLWHYPIFAFFRISGLSRQPNLTKYFFLIITLLLISFFSYYFIEKPFREKRRKFKFVIASISSFFCIIFIFYINIILNEGYKNRLPEILRNNYSLNESFNKLANTDDNYCLNPAIIKDCSFNKNFVSKIFLIGDSQVELLGKDLAKKLEKDKIQLLIYSLPGCLFFPGFSQTNRITKKIDKNCNNEYFQKLKRILLKEKKSIIIFGGRFPLYLSNKLFNNQEGGIEGDTWIDTYSSVDNYKTIGESFKNEVLEISKKNNVILIYPHPEVGFSPEHEILMEFIKNKLLNKKKDIGLFTTSFEVFKDRTKPSFELLDSIQNKNIYRVYPHELFCGTSIELLDRCLTHNDKHLFYIDNNHLSIFGSNLVNGLIINEIYKIKIKFLEN